MYRSITKFGFQRIVALLLLVTFAPLALLSEAAHLIPGFGENCGCFKAVCSSSLHNPNVTSSCDHGSHPNRDDANGVGAKCIGVDNGVEVISGIEEYGECDLHVFCLSFNSFGIVIIFPPVSGLVTEFDGIGLSVLSGEFYSYFRARAPPLV
ncbi:MAG: hypothetical protein LBT09_07365 [Planctomycetaceae bacterium]|jgi:hypothetical protein|nr:hypothetical protein [Planctomycetaceae bacterium]